MTRKLLKISFQVIVMLSNAQEWCGAVATGVSWCFLMFVPESRIGNHWGPYSVETWERYRNET